METFYSGFDGEIEITKADVKAPITMPHLHYHNYYELYLQEEGYRKYVFRDCFIHVEKRDVVLVKPYTTHTTGGGAYRRQLLIFKKEYPERYFTREAIEKLLQCFEQKKVHLSEEAFHEALELLRELSENPERFLSFAKLLELISHAQQMTLEEPKYSNTKTNDRNLAIVRYIEDHYDHLQGLEEIAEHFYLDKCTLSRCFKQFTGMTVVSYLNSLKLKSACQMLAETDASVKRIAEMSGFGDSVYFFKIFKANLHCTPLQYRKQCRESESVKSV